MATSRPIVFAGPTIAKGDILAIVPDADVRPPVRRGDFTRLPPRSLVAIIDGVFDAELSISPREIRLALARGVRVVGSSSMGALRACEVPQMIGIGRIFEMYRDGRIRRDDEVAILLDNETGRALTEPLVNVRFAVERLAASGSLAPERARNIVEAASELHFHDRTYRNILRKAGLAGAADIESLLQSLKAIDLKREDAISLLEQLDELGRHPRWNDAHATVDPEREIRDKLHRVRASSSTAADAHVLVWEYGDSVAFLDMVRFMALTGRLDRYARATVGRLAVAGALPSTKKRGAGTAPPPQEVFEEIWAAWGWTTDEEVHVTLSDLGVGLTEASAHCSAEHSLRALLSSLYASMPSWFLHALRIELLADDLALKRETMRYGALLGLARRAEGEVGASEREDAKRALLSTAIRGVWVESWDELLRRHSMTPDQAAPIVELVARARRFGEPILRSWTSQQAPSTAGLLGVAALPEARYVGTTRRSLPDSQGMAHAERLGKAIGVTRVAQLSELDRIGGLHISAAYRPSKMSTTIGSGKSETLEGAVIGGIMEEIEKHGQEGFDPPRERFSYEASDKSHTVDPRDLELPFDSTYRASRVLDWSLTTDLVSGERCFVPTSILVSHRLPGDVMFSPRLATRTFNSNGLAAGFSIPEALLHGLCELIERHSTKLAEQAVNNPGALPGTPDPPFYFVDLATCSAATRRICDALDTGGRDVRVLNVTSDIGVPSFIAKILRPNPLFGVEDWAIGYACHPSPEFAINRAILEAVQSVIMSISGAREDLSMRVRSLGRHERPRPGSFGLWNWFAPWVPKQSFQSIVGFSGASAREDVAFVVDRLRAASYSRVLYSDYSRAETAPAAVVRVIVPGLESTNALHTGVRARVHVVRDLMHRHEW